MKFNPPKNQWQNSENDSEKKIGKMKESKNHQELLITVQPVLNLRKENSFGHFDLG